MGIVGESGTLNQTSTDRLICLVAGLPCDLAGAILDAHRAAVVEIQGRADAAVALADKAISDLAHVMRDRGRLWDSYVELSQMYHAALGSAQRLRRVLAASRVVGRAVRRDLREAMREDRAKESRGVVGGEGIGMLLQEEI